MKEEVCDNEIPAYTVQAIIELTDDLTLNQYKALITFMLVNELPCSRASIKYWRRLNGLKKD